MFLEFSRRLTLAWIAASLALTTGCATTSAGTSDAKAVLALQRRLKKQAALIQDLKERNLVLEKRQHSRAADDVAVSDEGESLAAPAVTSEPPAPLPASFTAGQIAPAKVSRTAPVATPEPVSVSPAKTGEHYLYSKILETYRSRNALELQKTLGLLLKTYPESVFADNAIYMSGLLAFESGDYASASKAFDKLLKDYPRSNKAVAALFAMASIEKRTGRVLDAKRAFLQLRDLYPGSPEAARVSVELKLLESASLKHRES